MISDVTGMMRSGLLVVLVLLAATLGLRQFRGGIPEEELAERQTSVVDRARRMIEADFESKMATLSATARRAAQDPAIVAALELLSLEEQAGVDALVRRLAVESPGELMSIEVYDPTPRLRAWSGFAMPLDSAPEEASFLSRLQVRVAADGDQRAAMVVWSPVLSNGRVVGAVRAMRLVRVRVPVRNEYLSDISLADDWSLATDLDVDVHYDAIDRPDHVRLSAIDGTPILAISLTPPSRQDLEDRARIRYDDIAAVWLAIAAVILALLLVRWAGRRSWGFAPRVLCTTAILFSARVSMLLLRVPDRWQEGKAPLAPLFDPAHLASDIGLGLFRSTGDLALTALVALLASVLAARDRLPARLGEDRRDAAVSGAAAGVVAGLLFAAVALVARRILLDSTLDYFARSGLLPQRLVAVVFGSLLLLLLAASIASMALNARLVIESGWTFRRFFAGAVGAGVLMGLLSGIPPVGLAPAEQLALTGFVVTTLIATRAGPRGRKWPQSGYFLRSILLVVVVQALLLYPVLDRGIEVKERLRMEDAARSFTEDSDPRALLAIRQAVRSAVDRLDEEGWQQGGRPDSLLEDLLRGSLLSSLGTYEVSIAVLDSTGRVEGRNTASRTAAALARALQQDQADLALLRSIRRDRGRDGLVIEKITNPFELDRFDYIGIDETRQGRWVLVRASQHELLPSGNTPFPRVLVPSGYYGSLYPDLSIAEFRDGVLVRNFGSAFGRSFLDADVGLELERRESLWRQEDIRDRKYVTLYSREGTAEAWERPEPSLGRSIIAVRRRAVNLFDRLYYLLRLTVSGLILGLPVYLWGLGDRWFRGELPATRLRFQDKVLNAFFGVGLIAVLAMGWVGLRVVTGETDRALEGWLRQHLDRVEDAMALRAGPDEMPYRVLERTDVDSLAAQVGLDLNVYLGVELEATSRPQLVRDRLISTRIPIEAYNALFVSGFRFVSVRENLGRFSYTAGYRALPDEQGVPRYIVSVPTLPEQERIEEERARTAAYLFGALLLLMLVVMVTASVIANRLARPVARLQKGLQTVAEGRFERIGPLDSRDEIADLVGTFNQMQDQLAESRRLLAQHERQLAWREMARQVAHEIKNPLTPMKLTVQHLRKAFASDAEGSRFRELFRSRTATLIEQIDALARIANEFSSFARMPLQHLEPLDLNEVLREAVSLMQEHAHVDIQVELADEPLIVEADREALRRMYINFLKNGVEALDPARAGRIRVTSGREEDAETGNLWAVSAVADNGTGIATELQARVFNPSFSTKTSGTGLGLAIARNTVEELRGRIGFETDEGVGTVFWVRIPLVISSSSED